MPKTTTIASAPSTADAIGLAFEVQNFLYAEADLLDQWRLPEWLDLFTPRGEYLVPTTDKPDGDPSQHLFLVQDDRFLLEQRINSLMKRSAHAEYPHSRTSRMVGNIRACDLGGGQVEIRANFIVNRVRNGVLDAYIGQYEHLVERDESGQFKFVVRRSVLALDALRPHGKVSIIL